MTIAQICILLAIAVYLLAMLGVGVWFANKNRSVDDFYLADGSWGLCHRHECGGFGHEQLAADGPAGRGYLHGPCRGGGGTALGLVIGTISTG